MRPAVWLAVIMSTTFLLVPILVDDASADVPDRAIRVTQNGYTAELTVDLHPGEYVKWDLGDGRIVKGSSVTATWEPGFYSIQAAIISSTGETELLHRWIGFYDTAPATSIARNAEYRYCVYTAADSPSLIVKNSSGKTISWLTYDSDYRIVTGVARDTGVYHVWLDSRYWSIDVTDATQPAPWVRFNASVIGDTISAFPTGPATDTVTRYSWSLYDLDGSLTSAFEGKNLTMTTGPGYYVLKLQQIGSSGSTSYSQIVSVQSMPLPKPASEESPSVCLVIPVIASAVLLFVSVASRSAWPACGSLLCAVAAVLMVVI